MLHLTLMSLGVVDIMTQSDFGVTAIVFYVTADDITLGQFTNPVICTNWLTLSISINSPLGLDMGEW